MSKAIFRVSDIPWASVILHCRNDVLDVHIRTSPSEGHKITVLFDDRISCEALSQIIFNRHNKIYNACSMYLVKLSQEMYNVTVMNIKVNTLSLSKVHESSVRENSTKLNIHQYIDYIWSGLTLLYWDNHMTIDSSTWTPLLTRPMNCCCNLASDDTRHVYVTRTTSKHCMFTKLCHNYNAQKTITCLLRGPRCIHCRIHMIWGYGELADGIASCTHF